MGAKVYANGMEVSGKATPHKVLAAMPDVCLSPPSPPAGPIPIPYPNFAQGSDTSDGSKTVKAGGKEISLKGKSKYKKCKGDEAATRSFGANVISHNITGPVKHKAGSFDVKVEGSNVVRNLAALQDDGGRKLMRRAVAQIEVQRGDAIVVRAVTQQFGARAHLRRQERDKGRVGCRR